MTRIIKTKRSKHPSAKPLLEHLESRQLLSAVKIMPLGDSITESFPGHASYRFFLYNQLVQAGYDVDFIGGNTGVNGGTPIYTNFDQNHEGHSGWRADDIANNIIAFANANKPDVVLLHIGSNDIEQGQSNSSTITDISNIIDRLRSVVPNVQIVLAKIIPESTNTSQYPLLNNMIATLASQKNTANSPITLVDQYTGFNTSADTFDGVHPDDSGERKMSAKWFTALQGILPAPTPPQVTYLSNLNWTSMTSGWGPAEKDRSNGETGATDGNTLALNSNGYLKGLGTHASSDISYNIAGAGFTAFMSDIGVDEESGNNGSVVFQVYVDGALKYTSPTMRGSSTTQSINVPLSGASTLRLVVSDSGDGNSYDHGDWANARLANGTATPVPNAPAALDGTLVGSQVNLTWADASSDEVGFRVQRKTGAGGTYAQIADLPAGTQSYSDLNVSAGNTYFYQVYAYNAGGASQPSNEDSVNFPTPPPPPGTTYLSDLNYTVVSNGWGTPEKDRSNGEQGPADGKTITLNGVTYAKGIGMHAAAEIDYNLGGQYTQFLSDIGVDDEVGNNGSVVFQVWLDGVLTYTSPTMRGSSVTQSINLDTTGKSAMRLVVTNAGDGADFDHADWAGVRLVAGAPVPVPNAPTSLSATLNGSQVDLSWIDASSDETSFKVQRKQGAAGAWTTVQTLAANTQSWSDTSVLLPNTTYFYQVLASNAGGDSSPSNSPSINTPIASQVWLSDLTWTSSTNGWGPVEKDKSNGEQAAGDGKTISIRNSTYAKGLGVHGASDVRYNLGGSYSSFVSDIGVDNETNGNGSVVFQVYLDNVLVYDSGVVRGTDAVKSISLNVAGAQQLRLVVTNWTDGGNFDHADWAGAQLFT